MCITRKVSLLADQESTPGRLHHLSLSLYNVFIGADNGGDAISFAFICLRSGDCFHNERRGESVPLDRTNYVGSIVDSVFYLCCVYLPLSLSFFPNLCLPIRFGDSKSSSLLSFFRDAKAGLRREERWRREERESERDRCERERERERAREREREPWLSLAYSSASRFGCEGGLFPSFSSGERFETMRL